MTTKSALILVDLQNDFCEGGALEVAGGSTVIPLANRLQLYFEWVIATQDWHPANHSSFASNHSGKTSQILWPDHCIQGSSGADFHPDLDVSRICKIFHKGVESSIDSYSGFFDNEHLRATGLGDYLHQHGIENVYILGLATDYCVKYTALDAVHLGFTTYVIEDACRGVNLAEGDVVRALNEMRAAGVQVIHSDTIIKPS